MVATPFNVENFNECRRSISSAFFAENILRFVTGLRFLRETSSYLDQWQTYNEMIITWFLNSMIPEIRSSLKYITLAQDVWTDLQIRFTHSNGPGCLNLRSPWVNLLNQLSLSLHTIPNSKYYGIISAMWQTCQNVLVYVPANISHLNSQIITFSQ